jgi:hypothetical protein
MEGREKPHMDKYKEITNDWNYDASCTLTSLMILDLENCKRVVFDAESIQSLLLDSKFVTQKTLQF